ncbi:hypothetical protein fugu_013000 [Takifugu bimaculatus]|uniref:C2H2-type domain-containing protein n=1 Tax=Takifugu bimaculatus TaxID=433685 RepID=A0A4Z2C705_9TELE|nr:hypothetical protein fugu_013000 [Takifugu bimaculatus]
MAESETECDTPGLDTLGSECVIAHSHVDLHYGAETEIMTEEKRGIGAGNPRHRLKDPGTRRRPRDGDLRGRHRGGERPRLHQGGARRHAMLHRGGDQDGVGRDAARGGAAQDGERTRGEGFANNAFPKQRLLSVEKPYRCSQCGKGFNHSSSLSRHHRIHIDQ